MEGERHGDSLSRVALLLGGIESMKEDSADFVP